MSKFFIRRPIVAIVIAIITVIIGGVSMLTLPTSQYPDIVPPKSRCRQSTRRRRQDPVSSRVDTDRAANERCGQHAVHVLGERQQRQATVYVDFDVKTNSDTDQVLSQLRVSQAQAQLPRR